MASKLHDQLIAGLLQQFPALQTKRFIREVNEIITQDGWIDPFRPCVVPDAYVVHRPEQAICVFEVVVTNPVSPQKMDIYTDIGWALDEFDWSFSVLEVDKWGEIHYIDNCLLTIERTLAEAGYAV